MASADCPRPSVVMPGWVLLVSRSSTHANLVSNSVNLFNLIATMFQLIRVVAASGSLFLDASSCASVRAADSTWLELGRGGTKVVTLSQLHDTPVAVKHLLPPDKQALGFRSYADLLRESALLQEAFETGPDAAARFHGVCDVDGDSSDFLVVEYAPALTEKLLVALYKARGGDAIKHALERALAVLAALPSGPLLFRDVKWEQIGLLPPRQYRLNGSATWDLLGFRAPRAALDLRDPAEVARRLHTLWLREPASVPLSFSMLDLGCVGRPGALAEIMTRNHASVSRLMNGLRDLIAPSARAVGANASQQDTSPGRVGVGNGLQGVLGVLEHGWVKVVVYIAKSR